MMADPHSFLLNTHRTEFRQFQVAAPPAVGQTVHEHPVFGPLHDDGEGRLVTQDKRVVGAIDYARGAMQIVDLGNFEVLSPCISERDQKYGRVSLRAIMGDPRAAWQAAAGALFALGKPVSCLDCGAETTMEYRQESGDKHAGAGNLHLQCPTCGELSPITLRKATPPSAPDIRIRTSEHKPNADQTVAVATDVFWNEDMTTCPRGLKVQLLGEGGVASYGTYHGDRFWQAWAPVPKRRKLP